MIIPWAVAVRCVIGGTRLRTQRSLLFCQVVGGITCIFFPFGTVLGMLTRIVPPRPAARDAFDRLPAVGVGWDDVMRNE